jgi:hypothetical protein
MAWDAAGRAFYVGSLLRHKIVRIDPDGTTRDFVPAGVGGLGEVLGMKVDATRRELVAAAMGLGPRRQGSGLFRFDLATGRPTGSVVLDGHDRLHLWNDLAFLPSGGLVVTDSEEGTVYRVRGGRAERLLAPGALLYPNGISATPDGRRAFVAHDEGIAVLDLATRRLTPLPHPDGLALLGIDGLYLDLQPAGGRLIGVQNGTDPIRLIALPLDATLTRVTGLTILAARTPNLPSPTTGALWETTSITWRTPRPNNSATTAGCWCRWRSCGRWWCGRCGCLDSPHARPNRQLNDDPIWYPPSAWRNGAKTSR